MIGLIRQPGYARVAATLRKIRNDPSLLLSILGLRQQLEAGVRCFDIRCRCVGMPNDPSFAIYHTISQNLTFDDVLNDCLAFLNQNPSECIIMMIGEDEDPRNASFGEIFRTRYWQPNTKKKLR